MKIQSFRVLTTMLAISVLALASATSALAQDDHLQCHKVRDTQKFKAAVVALTAVQAGFQIPGNCTIKGKGAEFCVPVTKTVVDIGDAPGSYIGSGQDLSANDYVCYKMKCGKGGFADTVVTDQFGERALENVKVAKRICVPAVKGVVPPPECAEDGGPETCDEVGGGVDACFYCVETYASDSGSACASANVDYCLDPAENIACAEAVNAAGCGPVCCPNP